LFDKIHYHVLNLDVVDLMFLSFYFEKIRVFKAGINTYALNILASYNRIRLSILFLGFFYRIEK